MAQLFASQNQYAPSFWLLSFASFLVLVASQQNCLNQKCGTYILNVSFPFSLDSTSCPAFSPHFELLCSNNKIFLNTTTNGYSFPVLQIFNDSLIINISSVKSSIESQNCSSSFQSLELASYPGPYLFSRDNQFGSFNCSLGLLLTNQATNSSNSTDKFSHIEVGGCASQCPEDELNPDCGNKTCCVSSLGSEDVRGVEYIASNLSTSCAGFSIPFFKSFTDFDTSFGLKLLWALPSETNDTNAIKEEVDYACSENSNITLVSQVPGYLCRCEPGYAGDGYSKGRGCADINECADPGLNECIPGRTTCVNSNGSYTCRCKSRLLGGDGTTRGSGCGISAIARDALSSAGGLLGAVVIVSAIIYSVIFWRRRKRRRCFLQNGGLQLQEYISRRGRQTTSLFTAEELQLATQNFSDQVKLGVGGYGTVYKGTLKDGRIVAIKKANRSGDDNNQFLNEVSILTQINHRHIVRLLGCCLETETPLLVYEFVSNGTLSEHLVEAPISGKDVQSMGWKQRLQIASQTAEALAYLHDAAVPPILHRDVKSSNILLDDNLEVKVADFGVSRLVPDGEEHVSTAVQGTIGYLDPEYFQTLQLTDKSDVYSLGVVLIELVTGMKPVDNHSREARFANLALLLIDRMREGRLEELIDQRLVAEEEEQEDRRRRDRIHAAILEVALLARRCLALQGAQRPSMREAAEELRLIEKGLAAGLVAAATGSEEGEPLLSPGNPRHSFVGNDDAGAVVVAEGQGYVQSLSPPSSTGLTVDSLLLGLGPATAR